MFNDIKPDMTSRIAAVQRRPGVDQPLLPDRLRPQAYHKRMILRE